MKLFAYSAIILLISAANSVLAAGLISRDQLENTEYPTVIEAMIEQVRSNYQQASDSPADFDITQLEGLVGKRALVPMTSTHLGQPNVDFYNFYLKALEAYQKGLVTWKPRKKLYQLGSDGSGFLFGKDKPGKAVVIGDKLYLHDGNTKFLTSWFFGASQYWVTVTGYYPDRSIEDQDFIEQLQAEGKILLLNARGEKVHAPPSVDKVEDIPNRAFILAHRLSVQIPALLDPNFAMNKEFFSTFKDQLQYKGSPNFESTIFAKVNGDPSFLEVLLSIAAEVGGYRPPQEIHLYEPKKRHTEYLMVCFLRGLAEDHPASSRLASLTQVPLITRHGLYPDEASMTDFLKNHLKRQTRYENFSCSEEIDK